MNYDENFQRLIEDMEQDSIKLLHENNKSWFTKIFNYQNLTEIEKKQQQKDKFYSDLYNYYYNGGFYTIITSDITEIFSLVFGIFFMGFLFVFLDWGKILQCGKQNDIQDCGEITLYIKPRFPNIFFVFVLFIASFFTIYRFINFILNYRNLVKTHNYYKHVLKISTYNLQTMKWSNVISKISNNDKLSIYDITNIILKKQNFLLALINNYVINIPNCLYTKQLEINLKLIILNNLNVDEFSLKKKFIFYGIFNLFFSIFIFIYLLLYYFVNNIDEIYSNSKTSPVGSRRYTLLTKRKFKNYNEYPHYFEKRINKSMIYANEYLKQFPSPKTEIIAKFFVLLSGMFIGLFLIFSILDESILLYVRFLDRSLIFYTGVIGAVSSVARGFIKGPEDNIYNPEDIMKKIYVYTRYMPSNWIERCYTYDVRNEFLSMFQYKIILFIYDLIGVISTPFILIFILPQESRSIINFINNNKVCVENVGWICTFSQFKTDKKDKKMEESISYFEENNLNDDKFDSLFINSE